MWTLTEGVEAKDLTFEHIKEFVVDNDCICDEGWEGEACEIDNKNRKLVLVYD